MNTIANKTVDGVTWYSVITVEGNAVTRWGNWKTLEEAEKEKSDLDEVSKSAMEKG